MQGDNEDQNAASSPPPTTGAEPALQRGQRRQWPLIVGLALLTVLIGLGVWRGWLALEPRTTPAATPFPSPSVASPTPLASPASAPSPSPVAATYTVGPGDTLRSIAEAVYGDPEAWPVLHEANRDAIGPDPDAVQAGVQLRIPAR